MFVFIGYSDSRPSKIARHNMLVATDVFFVRMSKGSDSLDHKPDHS
jgi:hypothetical protein